MQLPRFVANIAKYWPVLLASGLALGALALLWRVGDTPLALGAFVRFDALSAFFLFALFGGAALALAARPADLPLRWFRPAVAAGALVVAYSATLTLAIAGAYLALALLTFGWPAPLKPDMPETWVKRATRVSARAVLAAPGLLAAICLLLGYAALALRGAARYDDRTAGAALDSFAFWFVLLAALIACAPLFQLAKDGERKTTDLFRFAWLYPLARLYTLGPWNSGWSFATLLLGGALALWCACSALVQPDRAARHTRVRSLYLALALAGLGLSNSAGVAAACYGVLAYLVLAVGHSDWGSELGDSASQSAGASRKKTEGISQPVVSNPQSLVPDPHSTSAIRLPWLLTSAVPLTAPFVAAWMLMGASVAGGVALLAGVAWLAALLHGLAVALWPDAALAQRPPLAAGVASLVLGVGAPPIVRLLILPAVAQLQGGLNPFGDVNIWPWVGVAASDSAHTQVATLPSVAIALLMLVLAALVYVVARLRQIRQADAALPGDSSQAAEMPGASLLGSLRDEVPWLGGLLGSHPSSQRHPGDGK